MTKTPAVIGGVALALTVASAAAEPTVVFRESFDQGRLGPGWTVDVSGENTVAVRDGTLEITAAEHTYAHIERPLGTDHVRAACAIRAGSGISWCTSIFLYWSPGDWCQMGIVPRGNGRYYACITTRGRREEHDLARCRFSEWRHVAIELGRDCIRFLSGADGRSWNTELLIPRPDALAGPPVLLIVGKGFGLDANQPDLDGDYGERGATAVSRVRDIVITRTDAARMTIREEERHAQAMADRDPLGTKVLSDGADPSYDAVAGLLPALSQPREVVGVPDHPYEIGVEYDGTIQIPDDTQTWEQTGAVAYFEWGTPPVRFGSTGCAKRLLDGHLPIVVCEHPDALLPCEETILGQSDGMSPDKPLNAYARLRIRNASTNDKVLSVRLRFRPEAVVREPLHRDVPIAAGASADFCVRIAVPLRPDSAAEITSQEFDRRLDEVARHWRETLGRGMVVEAPEQRVNDAWRAWLAYNYLNVDKKGDLYQPHDGGGFYEQVYGYSAALYCHALDLWGRHEDSRRYLESMLTLLRPDGLFFVNYGLPDHGALLLALCRHYRMTGDADWLRRAAPRMQAMCDWILRQRERATSRPSEPKPVTYGLIRFTPYADFQVPTSNYYADAYCCVGLEQVAAVFSEIGRKTEADRLGREASAYRGDILRSMDAAVIERDGMKLLPMEPDTHRLLKASGYKAGDYYGLVASMLLESEFLPASDPRARWVTDALEKRAGLILGMCEFDDGVDHAYTYGYWLNCLGRDEVRRVLLGFYGTLAYGMGRDTYCGVEVTQITTGEPTPTMPHLYSGTQQLRLLRMMLLREEDDELILGQAVPRPWLADGTRIEVKNAATAFGPASFRVESHVGREMIDVRIDPPSRRPPRVIRLRLRHPEDRPIRSAKADGGMTVQWAGDTLRFAPGSTPVTLRVRY